MGHSSNVQVEMSAFSWGNVPWNVGAMGKTYKQQDSLMTVSLLLRTHEGQLKAEVLCHCVFL